MSERLINVFNKGIIKTGFQGDAISIKDLLPVTWVEKIIIETYF